MTTTDPRAAAIEAAAEQILAVTPGGDMRGAVLAAERAVAAAVPHLTAIEAAEDASTRLAALSTWIDRWNRGTKDPEAVLWGRVAKIGEEHGEAIAALIGMTGQNPRKGVTHSRADLIGELLDVAITALGAVEHVEGNGGVALGMLFDKIAAVHDRALSPANGTNEGEVRA